MIHPIKIMWVRYSNGTVRYYADIPNTRSKRRRWAWQARIDRARHVRTLSAVSEDAHGVYDPEPYHGGFI